MCPPTSLADVPARRERQSGLEDDLFLASTGLLLFLGLLFLLLFGRSFGARAGRLLGFRYLGELGLLLGYHLHAAAHQRLVHFLSATDSGQLLTSRTLVVALLDFDHFQTLSSLTTEVETHDLKVMTPPQMKTFGVNNANPVTWERFSKRIPRAR